jgi:putative (di)nucleoside polyphosphate hydrolase
MKSKRPKPTLRPNVCMLLYNSTGRLWLGERYGKPGHWQLPQGGVEKGQSLRENVIRELTEELGVSKQVLGAITRLRARNRYLWKTVPEYARGRWRGQAQTFWLVEFTGGDSDIDVNAGGEPEFSAWRWCSVTTVRKIAARERVAGYEAALCEFSDFKRQGLPRQSSQARSKVARRKPVAPCRKQRQRKS